MILARFFLTLLGIMSLQSTGRAYLPEANDEQACMDLCKKCEGIAAFTDNICQCHVADDNQRGAECIGRIKRQAGELGLDIVSCNLADPEADRTARCVVSPFRRFRSQGDADLIANYFMTNGLRGFGSLLGSSKSQTGKETPVTEVNSSSEAENVGTVLNSSETKSDLDSALVSAPNPFSSANGQFMDINPVLGAVASWLQPNTLLGIGNGMQGAGTQGLVGQPSPSLTSTSTNHNYGIDSTHANFVGSQHQDNIGDSWSTGTHDLYSTYPAMVGMTPYSYFVGAPNTVKLQDGSQVPPMQPYLYGYNSMVEAPNPSFMGTNNAALSHFRNYPKSLVGANSPQLPDLAAAPKSNLDESAKADEDLLGEPNPDLGLETKKDTDLLDKADKLETISNEVKEPVISSNQTAKNLKEDAVNPEQIKDQTLGISDHSTKQKKSRFGLKKRDAKSEVMFENETPQGTSGAD